MSSIDLSSHNAVWLDAGTLGQDIDLLPVQSLIPTRVYGETDAADTASHIGHATIAITNKVVIDTTVMAQCPELRAIAVTATGTNNIDLDAAAARNIRIMPVTGYGTAAVAQHTLALMLAIATRLINYHQAVGNGRWSASRSFCLMDYPVMEIAGKTLGIIGYGELGRSVARLGEAFGMQVMVAARPGVTYGTECRRYTLKEIFAQADILSLHCLLSADTANLVNAETLSWMKPGAILINTARGGLIDETALLQALQSGQIGGAGLDGLSTEPPPANHPLLTAGLPNLIITPHSAWVSREARQRLINATANNIRQFLND